MSNVNVSRVIENIRGVTTVYTAIVEVIVNAIQATEQNSSQAGEVKIRAIRSAQLEADGSLPDITGFEIQDNGIGFTKENRDSFDTLYTDLKISDGGKGFGRFICLKYFDRLQVESDYKAQDSFFHRSFRMGKGKEIIVDESNGPSKASASRTIVRLEWIKKMKSLDKRLETIARNLAEKLLPYFITANYNCPKIVLSELDDSDAVVLNDFVSNQISSVIQEIPLTKDSFELTFDETIEQFHIRLFKFFFPKNLKSRISLVAHKREVSSSVLHGYIPEFSEDFYERTPGPDGGAARNYIVKAYVFGRFLDRHVSLERGSFDLSAGGEPLYKITQDDIETSAAEIAKEALGSDILIRQQKKQEDVQTYVDDLAPWHKYVVKSLDLTSMPYNPSAEEIEMRLQREKYRHEVQLRKDVDQILAGAALGDLRPNVARVVEAISESGKNDLVHYIALRRNILELFGKSLELDDGGAYQSEGLVHDIIFPRKGDTEITAFNDHNLWIIDERLNFSSYVSSDIPLNGGKSERPDLAVYDKRILFRGDNEASNPITIFEFKKPQRDDFVNPSSKDDPIQQIIRYVNSIRDGKYKTPKGKKMLVETNTPFYGYVVCDLTSKVEEWLLREKNFKVMPDRLGWFLWYENINLYIEVLSWDKILRDARLRNRIFFHKLGIS
ncbi:ATP-binding protein [Tunturibacter empetritectus]|uniref:Anti-sigma regulatory factor (Ser/Thr protein kinase) n=1 Tax=Tunturiibacter empetritectus TaxID=3069691 RepID=A0A7W8ILQ2_9BACT|nr:ATP-binding protein [Edaphobacter lichenicola]MBB5319441.1 anti-sigma regulatory factor (Ser/Thr protein kinase) [Edaphobacter lichenicola]